MATVLHRVTFQLLPSVNTPEYPIDTWVHNPDLSPVDGVPVKYWKLTGDVLSEMSAGEKDTVDAAGLPALKLTRHTEINTHTDELLLTGFEYPAESGQMFSLSVAERNAIFALDSMRSEVSLSYPIVWNTEDGTAKVSLADAAAVRAFALAAFGVYRAAYDAGTTLRDSIRAAADKAAVDAVVDNR